MDKKFIIYQLLPRIFGNKNLECVHNGSLLLNGSGKFSDITAERLKEIKSLKVTHVWYTGVIEHATKSNFTEFGIPLDNPTVIKGEAGSPYAIKDYYDVNPYLARDVEKRMEEFEKLVNRTHRAKLKVLIDFVPNHVAREYRSDSTPKGIVKFGKTDSPLATMEGASFGFHPRNNFYYIPRHNLDIGAITKERPQFFERPAKVTGNDSFTHTPSVNDWYETVKLNYGVDYQSGGVKHFSPIPKTWGMMLEILKFWAAKGVDGFRCDMVEMVPVEFWEWVIPQIKAEFPKVIFVAEVYNPALYDSYLNIGKFDYLYDKVGLYDTLKSVTQYSRGASSITNCWQNLGDKQSRMLNFLENHDEQRVASKFNVGDAFKAIPELVVSLMLNNAPFMLYFGQEFGEKAEFSEGFSGDDGRTSIFDYCSAPSVARYLSGSLKESEAKLYELYKTIFSVAMGHKAITEGETFDLQYANYNSNSFNCDTQYVFARKVANELIIVVVDFNMPHNGEAVSVSLPDHFFSYWSIEQKEECKAVELISNKQFSTPFSASEKFSAPLSEYGVGVYSISL